MKPSTLVSLALMSVGSVASLRILSQRQPRRALDKRVSIVVDFDDVRAVSIRAGLPLAELLPKLRDSGATHCTLPELTLNRLLHTGELFQGAPREPRTTRAPFGQWVYLSGTDESLVAKIVAELQARVPQLDAQISPNDCHTFAFAGDLPTIGAIGLGFDTQAAAEIHVAGLAVVPRPVSYDWHERALIERTLAQAASVGDDIVAFEGHLILGHEMHLNETLTALEANHLAFAYFAESHHQRGDWFIAKRRMPHVVSAHQFSPAQMIPEDYHSMAHHWANLARERGVRMMFVNFFRVVHATEPLECLNYLEHIHEAVEDEGFVVGQVASGKWQVTSDEVKIADRQSPIAVSLVPVGAGALATSHLLGLNDALTIGLAGVAAVGVSAIGGHLDKARNELEQQYAPTYSSKLLALGAATIAPLAAIAAAHDCDSTLETLLIDSITSASAAATIAALTSSDEYRMRVEEYKGFDLDLWLPLAGALLAQRDLAARAKIIALAGTLVGWQATRRFAPNPLARLDASPAMSHTHHLSTAMRMVGDTALALGPRPIRKWAGLAPFGITLSVAARRRGLRSLALAATIVSLIGHAATHTGFRRPERDPILTAESVGKSWLVGSVAGLVIAALISNFKFQISDSADNLKSEI